MTEEEGRGKRYNRKRKWWRQERKTLQTERQSCSIVAEERQSRGE
jgi:hypothetical protein